MQLFNVFIFQNKICLEKYNFALPKQVKMAHKTAIVMDNGSYMTKAGFASDDAPKTEFLTKVGTLREQLTDGSIDISKSGLKECYVGNEVETKRGVLTIKYPVEHGVIENWDEMEKVGPPPPCL